MNDLKNILRDVGYFSIGAAAVILEAGGKAVKCLVRKGEQTLRENQDTVDEIKEKAKEAGERIKAAVKDLTDKPEPTVEATPAEDAPAEDAPVEEAPAEEDAPIIPDAIYRTDEPVPQEESAADTAEEDEHPEETPNG